MSMDSCMPFVIWMETLQRATEAWSEEDGGEQEILVSIHNQRAADRLIGSASIAKERRRSSSRIRNQRNN